MSESRISFGRAFFVSALMLAGCSRGSADAAAAHASAETGAEAHAGADADAGAHAEADAGAGADAFTVTFTGTGTGERRDEGNAAFATAKPLSGKSIGHTSVVFKLRLEGDLSAAYKPESKRGHTRYRGEIAAYRLGVALGLRNVPPALPRAFDADALKSAVGTEAIYDDVVIAKDGRVHGAIIPWIKGLDFVPLERDPWLARWHGWLAKGGAIEGDQRATASQISTMVVFDYVTGNWDRWSGGNVGIDAAKTTILYVDNDGAFFDPPPAPALARQLAILEKVDRFSRSFITALRALDLRAAIGDEQPGTPLLATRVLEQAEARRKKALAVVDAKVKALGDGEVLFFE